MRKITRYIKALIREKPSRRDTIKCQRKYIRETIRYLITPAEQKRRIRHLLKHENDKKHK